MIENVIDFVTLPFVFVTDFIERVDVSIDTRFYDLYLEISL